MPCIEDDYTIRGSPKKRLSSKILFRRRGVTKIDGRIAKALFSENAPADDETFYKLSDILANDVTGLKSACIEYTIGKKGRWNLAKMLPSEILEMEQEFFGFEPDVASVSYVHKQGARINQIIFDRSPVVPAHEIFPDKFHRTDIDRIVVKQDNETIDLTGKFYRSPTFIKMSETNVPKIHVQYMVTEYENTRKLHNCGKWEVYFFVYLGKKATKKNSAELIREWRREKREDEMEDIEPDFPMNCSSYWEKDCDENKEKDTSTRKEFTLADFIAGGMIQRRTKKPTSDWIFVTDMN